MWKTFVCGSSIGGGILVRVAAGFPSSLKKSCNHGFVLFKLCWKPSAVCHHCPQVCPAGSVCPFRSLWCSKNIIFQAIRAEYGCHMLVWLGIFQLFYGSEISGKSTQICIEVLLPKTRRATTLCVDSHFVLKWNDLATFSSWKFSCLSEILLFCIPLNPAPLLTFHETQVCFLSLLFVFLIFFL